MLHIDTDQVYSLSNQLLQAQDEIEQSAQRVLADASSVDWISPGRDSFVAEIESLCQQVRQLTEQGRDLAQRLNREAAEWEAAGQTVSGASLAAGIGVSIIDSGGGNILPSVVLPAILSAVGMTVGPGVVAIGTGLANAPRWIQDVINKFKLGSPDASNGQRSLPNGWTEQPKGSNSASESGKSSFGKIMEKTGQDETATSSAAPSTSSFAATTPAEVKAETAPSSWYRDVPIQNQQTLKYNGKPTDFGCTPSGASMITDYWHQQDPTNQVISAQELLNKNVTEKEFNPNKGLGQDELADDLGPLGYTVETHWDKGEGQAEKLKNAVSQGPVLAVVTFKMNDTSNTAHTVVITGISPEGKVRINDPWDGQVKEYSWEKFDKAWGHQFYTDSGNPAVTRIFTTINPKAG